MPYYRHRFLGKVTWKSQLFASSEQTPLNVSNSHQALTFSMKKFCPGYGVKYVTVKHSLWGEVND